MLTLILGGARSGKSRYAQSLFADVDARERVVFVATAMVGDDSEMASRVLRHQAERPPRFETVEAPLDLVAAVGAEPRNAAVLVDCVTLWLSNAMYHHRDLGREAREEKILADVSALIEVSRERHVVLVSNEVGFGIVPESAVAREFRDLQGRANQVLAGAASRVVLMVSGIPLALK
jgi:adenosylcobinamide kinase/adenosylcobinamide-phosphate guanylyltransferase